MAVILDQIHSFKLANVEKRFGVLFCMLYINLINISIFRKMQSYSSVYQLIRVSRLNPEIKRGNLDGEV